LKKGNMYHRKGMKMTNKKKEKKVPCQLCGNGVKAGKIAKLRNHRNKRSIKICTLCLSDLVKAKLVVME